MIGASEFRRAACGRRRTYPRRGEHRTGADGGPRRPFRPRAPGAGAALAGRGGAGPAAARAERAAGGRAGARRRLAAHRRRGPAAGRRVAAGRRRAGGPGLRRTPVRRLRPRGWATGARCCSASSSTPTAGFATCISRARAAPRSRAAATASPPSGRCCASTSSARRCTRWASPRPARSPSSRPGRPGAPRDRAARRGARPRRRAATCGSAVSSTPAATGDVDLLRRLADHAIARHHPRAAGAEQPYLALFEAVVAAQASLVARWMLVGFVHGVMNTDNMTISGETIDYGPCAFLDAFDPATVYSSIDDGGRYAYGNQPLVAEWNLARLAEALLPLIDDDQEQAVALAVESLGGFRPRVRRGLVGRHAGQARPAGRARRRGRRAADRRPARAAAGRPRRPTRRSSAPSARRPGATPSPRAGWCSTSRPSTPGPSAGGAWARTPTRWTGSTRSTSRATTWSRRPSTAATGGDLDPLARLLDAVTRPFDVRPGLERYAAPAPADFGGPTGPSAAPDPRAGSAAAEGGRRDRADPGGLLLVLREARVAARLLGVDAVPLVHR